MRCWPNKNEKLCVIVGKKNQSWRLNKESLKCLVPFTHGFFFLNMYYCCQTQICVPNTQKGQTNPNPFGVEKGLFIAGPCKEKGIAHAQKIQSPHWASGKKLLQASFGERSAGCVTFFWVDCWWGNRVVFQESQPSAFWFQTGVHMICSGWIYHPPPGWEP